MTDPGVQFDEVRDGKRRWFEPRFTAGNLGSILMTAIVGASLYYGLVGQSNSQAKDIAALQQVVAPLPSMETDIVVLKNSMAQRGAARDAQVTNITSQVGSLNGRVDKVETTFDDKLDKIATDISAIKVQVGALAALSGVPRP